MLTSLKQQKFRTFFEQTSKLGRNNDNCVTTLELIVGVDGVVVVQATTSTLKDQVLQVWVHTLTDWEFGDQTK